jgi:hypothetical protein
MNPAPTTSSLLQNPFNFGYNTAAFLSAASEASP